MIFLMDLPAPVHGMSNVNLSVSEAAKEEGICFNVINTVPSYVARFFPGKRWFILKLGHTVMCLIKLIYTFLFAKGKSLYRPINGGIGQIFDILYIAISRMFTNKIFIHHHSFNYLNKSSSLFSFLNKLAGRRAIHIVLGERMGELLEAKYKIDTNRIKIVSNLAFFEADLVPNTSNPSQLSLGHLANLSSEKGVDTFIEVCKELKKYGIDFKAKIAGPFVNEDTKTLVLESTTLLPEIEYIGPVYAKDKYSFYKTLDCFVFPSKYKNEAEPLVLYEAAMHGVYLAGTQRGCMEKVIDNLDGYSVNENVNVAVSIAKNIEYQCNNKGFSENSRTKRLDLFHQEQVKAKSCLTSLLKEMNEQ